MPDSMVQSTPLSISELNDQAKHLLESHFRLVTVEGEVSNFTSAASGHWYFTLKDDLAQVSCAMFAGANRQIRTPPEQGDKVIVEAAVSLYTTRGSFQLIVKTMYLSGFGQWHIAYARLHRRLADEGLFNTEKKQRLPKIPKRLGIVSSLKGAVVHDIIRTVHRRYDLLPVRIYPSTVQGEQAANELVQAIQLAEEDGSCDVLIIARGGGSIEDLWSFNTEDVARAIANCPIVTVSAVGHENDFTIADFVADVRASTPTAAAELVTPEKKELSTQVDTLARTLTERIALLLDNAQMGIDQLSARLVHPGIALELRQTRIENLANTLHMKVTSLLDAKMHALKLISAQLMQLDYHKPLKRGYALANTPQGQLLTSADMAKKAKRMHLTFHDGTLPVHTSDE